MSFDWQNYYHLAEYLFKKIQSSTEDPLAPLPEAEAFYRTIVSRAYYGTFCLARKHAKENDGFTIRGTTHQSLQEHFTKNNRHQLRCKIGRQLKRLHQERIKADYEDELSENAYTSASKALAQASRILQNLEELY